ncbi:MAG: hypothetical protein ABIU96_01845 [Rhodanobacter sp.]
MYRACNPSSLRYRQRVLGGILLWLLVGSILLLTGLAPAYSVVLGWSLAFWLVPAPLAMLLVLEPGLPRQALACWIPSRRARRATQWN